jgi:hypothetical protein
MLLIAVAATSRKRYPRLSDREAFTTFLRDEIWRLVREHDDFVVYHGRKQPMEEFLYDYLRCQLIHKGSTPVDLYPMRDGDVLTIDYPDGSGVTFKRLFLTRLNYVVWRAPENSCEEVKREMDAITQRRTNHRLQRMQNRAGKL